ncbi:MAG: prolyl oligopeptidase family serine peptidase [Phocaeicola sp.]|uniref:SGNH/GDSL hydrolase family protein n=1 Tax=Phocaeicola sp. TaxID=2773926 RepID=UPI0023C9B0DE|nr:GDSL-type esterase/lipase family protein [Phocaeicola sp.]MDE5677890.1 prolyl oligopeptidase family serine peptidase [Phocaeicola sp.]MDE6179703.1 prolyl oligopeptidase family serine peptidase [Phocaeicola sp.]
MKKQLSLIVLLLALALNVQSQETADVIKVACVGNSITYGAGINNRDRDSYPSVLGQMLGSEYEVRNFGFSGRTMLMKGDRPYMKEQMYQEALQYNPDIVIIKLGTNDSKSFNWKHKADFLRDMQAMVNAFRSIPSKPQIYLCYPAKAYQLQYGINDSIITHGVIPMIDKVAKANKLPVVDLHTATNGMESNFPDKIHPSPLGAHKIAATVYKVLTGKESVHCMQAFPGFKGEWNGCDRYDFRFKGRDVIVVVPQKAAEGKPWIWRPAFFDAFPAVDKALLEKGFHVVYYDVTHSYGNPRAVALGTEFYHYMRNFYGLSSKVTLEGFSRGGLYALNWAAVNPDKVACIYVDAPVCNVFSWPGRKRADLWNDLLKEWNLTDEEMNSFKGNPIDCMEPLAKADVPIISVCGDADKVVPYEENMAVLQARYRALGGRVEVILKPGVDHHPHSLENPEPVLEFILRHQPGYDRYVHYNVRGSLQNSLVKFEKGQKARVAFLGGSITEMNGWKNRIEQQLRQRFPHTEFEFVEAGIGSTGTTPGAFRLQHDVLSKGKIDLLFVEAAVNDHTNYFTPQEQVRGMEGEVRHALMENPEMDIVMLHFTTEPFVPMMARSQQPDVVLNHERVANHYLIPSVNLVQEISERMQVGEFTWEQFGGTHPLPLGHQYYAAAIRHLFDAMWKNVTSDMPVVAHEIPEPLDSCSYYGGDFIDLKEARLHKGWKYVPSWRADNNYEKRNGFVDVPMLEATHPGDKLSLHFTGRAIGIFCTPGPTAGIIEYSVDGAPFKRLDTYTEWSQYLYIPWVYMLETDLENTDHRLVLRISKEKNPESKGTECQIRNFVVNR